MDPAVLTGAFDTRATAALGCFTEGCGLWRAGAIARDMHEIARHTAGDMPSRLEPSEHATSYADDLVIRTSFAKVTSVNRNSGP